MLWFLFLLFFFFLFLFKKISLRNNSFCSYGNVLETWLRMIMLLCWHPSAQKQCLMVNEWPGLNASPTALFVRAHALHLTLYWHKKTNLDWTLIGAVPFMVNWKMFETLFSIETETTNQVFTRLGGVSPLMKYCTKHKLRKVSLWKLSNAICSVSDATVHLYNLQLNTGRFILNQILLF